MKHFARPAVVALLLTAALAPARANAVDSSAPFTVIGDYVTIHGVATVRLAELKSAVDSVRAAGRHGGRTAAYAVLERLPADLTAAALWEMSHGVETPPEDAERAVGTDPEPPVEASDPAKTVDNATSANYTTPEPTVVCTWYNAADRRQMNSAIFRTTLYRFHIDVTWRGCDNGTNQSAEPFLVWYSEVDILWNCENGELRKESGPLNSTPWIKHFATGRCQAGVELNGRTWNLGHNQPYINNTYNWTGARDTREGSAH